MNKAHRSVEEAKDYQLISLTSQTKLSAILEYPTNMNKTDWVRTSNWNIWSGDDLPSNLQLLGEVQIQQLSPCPTSCHKSTNHFYTKQKEKQ